MHVPQFTSRRDFLRSAGSGFGALALSALAAEEAAASDAPASADPLAPKKAHFEGTAKSVIFLFMEGGPSHVDLFDPKPELTKRHGQKLPAWGGSAGRTDCGPHRRRRVYERRLYNPAPKRT